MIPTILFIALLCIDCVLIGVVVFAHDNEMYLDILAAVAASVTSWYLSLCMINGNVGETIILKNTTIANNTTGVTEFAYTTISTPIVDPALSGALACCAIIMTIVSFGLVLGAGLEILAEEK